MYHLATSAINPVNMGGASTHGLATASITDDQSIDSWLK